MDMAAILLWNNRRAIRRAPSPIKRAGGRARDPERRPAVALSSGAFPLPFAELFLEN